MRRVTGRLAHGLCRRLRAASLLEAVVAAVLFLTAFAAAEYRVGQVFGKYATGLWPCGEYAEQYGWGSVEIRIAFYRDFADMQVVTVMAQVGGSRKKIVHKQLVSCVQ